MRYRKYAQTVAKKYPAVRRRYNVYAPAVKQLYKDVKYIKGVINSEPHVHTVQATGNFDYNGVVLSLANIPMGDTYLSRTGNRVLPRYFNINLHVNKDTAGIMHNTVRIIIFRSWIDNGTTAGTLAVSEVLESVGSAYAPLSHLEQSITGPKGDRCRRIEILKNRLITFDQVSNTSYTKNFNLTMNGGQVKEHIDFVSSSTAEPSSGGLFIMFVSESITAADVSYRFESRLTFYDN